MTVPVREPGARAGLIMKVVILGAGRGGAALIDLLAHSAGVEVAGVADVNPDAPGLRLAERLSIPTASRAGDVALSDDIDLIIDVTGDPNLEPQLAPMTSKAEWLGGTAARLVWLLVQQQHELRAQLMRADKLATIGTFAAQIAHDLKNPLYCIREFTRLIDDEQDLERIKDYAHEIEKADRYLTSIVGGLTGYARNAEGKTEEVAIADVLDQALTLSRYATPSTDVEVLRHYAAVPTLAADPSDLLQIFVNLITNAVQAMDGQGRLTLRVAREEAALAVTVEDTGPGIAPEHREKIFLPFFTTKDRTIGTGLGLSIVRSLVTKYDGDVAVESEPGKGARFQVRFRL